MKRFLSSFLFGGGVLVLGLATAAQTWAQYPYYTPRQDPYYGNRGGYPDDRYSGSYGSGYGYGRSPQYLIGRVIDDLNRAAQRSYLDRHEARHFDEVAGNLQDFEARWARGKFDTGKLDRAIHNLEHLAQADRVRGRDRDMLARDLYDLREFRASRGRYDRGSSYYPNWR